MIYPEVEKLADLFERDAPTIKVVSKTVSEYFFQVGDEIRIIYQPRYASLCSINKIGFDRCFTEEECKLLYKSIGGWVDRAHEKAKRKQDQVDRTKILNDLDALFKKEHI